MGCLLKAKTLYYQETDSMVVIITVNNVIVFTKQPSAERFLANLFFTSNFMSFQKILAAHQKRSENFQKVHKKNPPVAKSYFSKVAGFYRSCHLRCSVKNGILRKMLAKFTEKHLCQRLYYDKGM